MKNLSTKGIVLVNGDALAAEIEEQLIEAYSEGAQYSLHAFRPKYVVTDHSISEEAHRYVAQLSKETQS